MSKKLIVIAALALAPVFSAQEMVTKPVQSYQTAQYQSKKKAFVDNLLSKMTLDEKIGQLNLPSSGDFTTGLAKSSDIGKKIEQGLVGGLFNIKGADKIRAVQKVAVENSRLKIPLIFEGINPQFSKNVQRKNLLNPFKKLTDQTNNRPNYSTVTLLAKFLG
jgi:beta-glucosidase